MKAVDKRWAIHAVARPQGPPAKQEVGGASRSRWDTRGYNSQVRRRARREGKFVEDVNDLFLSAQAAAADDTSRRKKEAAMPFLASKASSSDTEWRPPPPPTSTSHSANPEHPTARKTCPPSSYPRWMVPPKRKHCSDVHDASASMGIEVKGEEDEQLQPPKLEPIEPDEL